MAKIAKCLKLTLAVSAVLALLYTTIFRVTEMSKAVAPNVTISELWRQDPVQALKVRRATWQRYSMLSLNQTKSQRLPDVVGIGVKKCGTDAIISFLRHHPFIETPVNVESFFFNGKYKEGLGFYKGLMPKVSDHELVMEKTPAYFNSPPMDLPNRIKQDLPDAKLILVLCDPVKRAFSDYTHERVRFEKYDAKVVAQYGTFDSYLGVYLDRVRSTLSGSNNDILNRHMKTYYSDHAATILETGLYSVHLPRWKDLFDSTRLLILNGEDLIKDPGPEVEKMQEFLGIPKLLLAGDFIRHPTTGLFCLRPYWKDYDFDLERQGVPGWEERLSCLSNTKGRTRHAGGSMLASEEHIASLRSLYKKFNDELYAMTGIKY